MKFENGHTNNVNKRGNEVVVEKTFTGFNHKINYASLSEFDFVPKLIYESEKEICWEYIEGNEVTEPTNEDLKQIAGTLRKIHKSNVKLPPTNLRKRVHEYLRIVHDKYIKDPLIEDNYGTVKKLLANMGNKNPLHADVWAHNLIKDNAGKIWFIDWEYSIMGDKHFDLAYYIEAQRLSKEQEKIFLKEYNSHDDYQAWIPEWMNSYKLFVNYLTLLWAYVQDEEPFDLTYVKKRIKTLM